MNRANEDRIEEAAREAARAAAEDIYEEEADRDIGDGYENDDEANRDIIIEETHVDNHVENTDKRTGVGRTIVISLLTTTLLIGGWHLIKHSKTGDVKIAPTDTKAAEEVAEDPVKTENISEEVQYDTDENIVIVAAEPEEVEMPETEEAEAPEIVEAEVPEEEETYVTAEDVRETYTEDAETESVVSTANFENMVAGYASRYSNEYSAVSTADITKFAAIANIDLLAEENPELLSEIANGQTKEEFLNDAAKLIGATVMYNFNAWNSTNSTDGFIRVSNIICGEQRDQMLKIEEYVDRIADAANKADADLVNEIVSEFILDMNSGDLSKLDDGVGFVAQVNIAMISDGIARNYLNQQNFDMLQILKTSEKYVSNIFRVYEKCTEDAKTRTR